ncbi:MAG: alpha/beta hydrolase [Actinomycetia bacterium]|nr:alpha/beta hydrolase [Actinomycetes bacterium]MCP4958836.1 alpha/beta hydrolase [Actinomycetes bacterium]
MAYESNDVIIGGDGPALEGYLTWPTNAGRSRPGVVLVHGFPSIARPGAPSRSYHLLAGRISDELGWGALALSLRGCGDSQGQFSVDGWLDDINRAVDYLSERARHVCLIGSTTGGSLSIIAASQNEKVQGVATIAARADFDDWAGEPGLFLEHCRRVNVISEPGFPVEPAAWAEQIAANRAIDHVAGLRGRDLLVIHGASDRQVPAGDARELADAHASAHLRILDGGDHRVRHDPRCVALLLGWLDRASD